MFIFRARTHAIDNHFGLLIAIVNKARFMGTKFVNQVSFAGMQVFA